MGKIKDLLGRRFSRLVVVKSLGLLDGRRVSWECQCDCGNTVVLKSGDLTSGHTKSCGCLAIDKATERIIAIGHAQTGVNNPHYGKPASHGKKVWYTKNICMRSSWEAAVATLLDKMHVRWEYEPEAFPITYEGKQGTYRPDFYLPDKEMYLEVKGYWRDNARAKLEAFTAQYPKKRLLLLDKAGLQRMGFI